MSRILARRSLHPDGLVISGAAFTDLPGWTLPPITYRAGTTIKLSLYVPLITVSGALTVAFDVKDQDNRRLITKSTPIAAGASAELRTDAFLPRTGLYDLADGDVLELRVQGAIPAGGANTASVVTSVDNALFGTQIVDLAVTEYENA